jgi:hypothetical protein
MLFMKWDTLSVDGEMGCENGFPCSICGGIVYDFIYFTADFDCPETRRLLDWWNAHAGVYSEIRLILPLVTIAIRGSMTCWLKNAEVILHSQVMRILVLYHQRG